MRRKDREIKDINTIIDIIDRCDIIRLGINDDDFPYIVPMNFAYEIKEDQIIFYVHGAKAGRRYEALLKHPYCSFEMDIPIQMECVEVERDVTMRYQSVMGTCEVNFIEGKEKERIMDEIVMQRYDLTKDFAYNKAPLERTAFMALKVLAISGKQNIGKDGD